MNSLWNKWMIDRIYRANSRINLNKVGASLMEQKCHWQYYINILVSGYLFFNWKEWLPIDGTKTLSTGFIYFSNHDTSNIPNISNPNVNLSLAYQTKCDNMFSYPESDHIFHISRVRTWFIFCVFSYVAIIHLLRRGEGVGIYCQLIPDWIESTQAQMFSRQIQNGDTEPNSK